MIVFAGVTGQDQVCAYLQAALDAQRTTHAYLLAGTDTRGAEDVARSFAAALVADGDDQAFDQALRGAHPDVHVFEPAGAAGYLVDQVRELVRDAELAPLRSQHKAYIVKDADRLAGAPANALLKTLEEPPQDVVCILLASQESGVLETIRSRCEVLHLRANHPEQPEDEEVFQLVCAVASRASNRQVLAYAKRLVERSTEGLDDLEDAHAEQLERAGEFLTPGARKEMEAQHKREVSARTRATLLEEVAAIRSWLRDCLLTAEGAPERIAHPRWQAQTMQVATDAGTSSLLKALEAVRTCEQRISYNVTPQLAMEALLFEIREAVCQ